MLLNSIFPIHFIYKFHVHEKRILVPLVFVAARRLSLVAVSEGYSLLRCTGFHCGFLLRSMGAQGSIAVTQGVISCGSQALEHAGSSICGALALVACGM